MFPLLREKVIAFDSSADTIAKFDIIEPRCQHEDPVARRRAFVTCFAHVGTIPLQMMALAGA